MIVTVYNKETKEVLASVDANSAEGFHSKEIATCISNYEPVFYMKEDKKLYFDEDKFVIKI